MTIADNVARVREQMARASERSGRRPEEVLLMAVTKTHPAERIREAHAAGLRCFGENRVQEFSGKAGALSSLDHCAWHMIGHLQSNKAAKAAELFTAVDSIDSVKLAERLDAAARRLGKQMDILIEINVGGEAAKSGVMPDSEELESVLAALPGFAGLKLRGLMTVPPFADDSQHARPYFRKLRELRDAIARRKLPAVHMDVLSMGMSHDFEVAIEEGSTCVRVGTALFGERPRP
jgi:PLP dependent protein